MSQTGRACAESCRRLAWSDRRRDAGGAARARAFHALGHRARLKIVWLLARHGELCVRAFPCCVGISQPTVSHHLRILRDAGIVGMQRKGHRRYYALRQDTVKVLLQGLMGAL